jgi:ribose transport system substrate-binding protein
LPNQKIPPLYQNTEGGLMCADALAEAIGYKGKVYAQATTPGVSTGDQRIQGFEQGISAYPDIEYVGLDYNDDDIALSTSQTTAVLEREQDLVGIFANNVMGAVGAGLAVQNAGLEGEVKVIAFDATKEAAENMEKGIVSMALAQKPFDMGLFAVLIGYAYLEGVEQIPIRIPTGYVVITQDNMNDPEIAKWIYQE